MENLRPAARHAAESAGLEFFDHLADRPISEMAEPVDLHRGPRLQMQTRIRFVQDLDDIEIPFDRHLVMQAADDVHLGATVFHGLGAPFENLFVAHQVPARVLQIGTKRAEDAAIDADVRRVQMRVDVVIRIVAIDPLADDVGQRAKLVEIDLGRIEMQPVVERESLAVQNLGSNIGKSRHLFPRRYLFHHGGTEDAEPESIHRFRR